MRCEMKKYVKYLIVLASALVSMSCGEPEADPFLYLSFPSVSAEAEGKTIDLTVSSNQSWTASADVPWLTVSPASGTGSVDVKVTVAGNNDEARKGVVTFSWSGKPATLTVQQASGKKEEPEPEDGTLTIAQLRKLYDEGQVKNKYNTTARYIIQGSVISDYREAGLDNYTSAKAIVISDGEAGIMLYCDNYNTSFKPGDEVKVVVPKGQELSRYNEGPVQLNGIKMAGITKVGDKPLEPVEISAADLLTNKYESMYVAVKDVQVQSSEIGKTIVMNGKHTSIIMEGRNGEVFDIFTSKYAKFGNEKVPTGSGTLKGIGSIYGERMQLCIAKVGDYAGLTGERFAGAASFSLFYSEYTHSGDKGSYVVDYKVLSGDASVGETVLLIAVRREWAEALRKGFRSKNLVPKGMEVDVLSLMNHMDVAAGIKDIECVIKADYFGVTMLWLSKDHLHALRCVSTLSLVNASMEEAAAILADGISEQMKQAKEQNSVPDVKQVHICGEMAMEPLFVQKLREKLDAGCKVVLMDSFSNLRLPVDEADSAAVLNCAGAIGTALGVMEGV